ncbi:hypothetical protein B0H11DRAFT_1899972 [Mycena galericulata]|nr:hypothetical protein B0H11DRAFT_1899972 [Mycena galericulata]
MVAICAPYARLGEDAIVAPTSEASVQWRDDRRYEERYCTRMQTRSAACGYLIMSRFRLLHQACAHGRRTIPTWACTPMPATQRDDDEHKQPGLEAVPCFASQSASGKPNVAEVRQKLKRVVWSITRQPCSRTRIELHMHRGRGFHAQCCVCSWMSFLCAHAGASQKRRTKRWVMQRSEVDRAVGCAVRSQCLKVYVGV